MKNNIKAIAYIGVGFVGAVLFLVGITKMWLSAKFLPVYVGTTYVIGNQILRYFLYALLIVGVALSVKLADYGMSFLVKRFHKTRRR